MTLKELSSQSGHMMYFLTFSFIRERLGIASEQVDRSFRPVCNHTLENVSSPQILTLAAHTTGFISRCTFAQSRRRSSLNCEEVNPVGLFDGLPRGHTRG